MTTLQAYHALALYNFISNFLNASFKKKRKLRLRWSKQHAINHINHEVELRFKTICPFFFKLFLLMLGLLCCMGFSLVAANGGYYLVVVLGLLIAVASLVTEHGLSSCGSRAPVHKLCGVLA